MARDGGDDWVEDRFHKGKKIDSRVGRGGVVRVTRLEHLQSFHRARFYNNNLIKERR